jgi:hypothetical protein
MGGVNVNCSESDGDYAPSDSEWSEAETVEELEENELETNLEELQAEAKLLESSTKYVQLTALKLKKDWKKAEGNQGFGYTGNSQHTKQRREKEAKDLLKMKQKNQTS